MSGQTPPPSPLEPAQAHIDITAETCPLTFVRAKLALEKLAPGALLAVRLRGAEPLANVPRSAREQGHTVVSLTEQNGGDWLLLLRRGGD